MQNNHMMSTYAKEILIEHGSGCYVYGKMKNGKTKKFLDLIGGIATVSVGHANKKVNNAIKVQAGKLINASNLYYSFPQIKLSSKLAKISGLEKVFLCNSGTEAVECAIKLAKKVTAKKNIIAMKNGFHGRTLGSLSATWKNKYKKPFGKLIPGFSHVEFGNVNELVKGITKDTAAVILEPIQGEAGVVMPSSKYLMQVSELCKKKNVLLILDEIQTGCGRTGKFFCYQNHGIKPDIVTVAKGIANGLPLGAVIAKKGIDFETGDHGSTFGGNALCCAAALETINEIESISDVAQKGEYFKEKLKELMLPCIKEVRGKGLMIAVETNLNAKKLVKKCAENNLLVNAVTENTLRFLPPLIISYKEIDKAVQVIAKVLKEESLVENY